MWVLLAGVLPLIIFAVVDSFAPMKKALAVAVAIAVLEGVFSYFYLGELDSVTVFSVLTVVGMAAISMKKGSPLIFKLQPVLIGGLFALALIISSVVGEPLFYVLTLKYRDVMLGMVEESLAGTQALANLRFNLYNPLALEFLKTMTWVQGIMLGLHAGLVAYAAFKMSKWWWVAFRVVGFYVFLFLGMVVSRFV